MKPLSNIKAFAAELDRVRALHAQGSYMEAFAQVERLRKSHPYSAVLLLMRASLIQLLPEDAGDGATLGDAHTALQHARLLLPHGIEIALEHGHFAHAVLSDSDAALAGFEAARAGAETAMRAALVGKIQCYLEQGERDLAEQEWREAIRLFEDDLDLQEFASTFAPDSED